MTGPAGQAERNQTLKLHVDQSEEYESLYTKAAGKKLTWDWLVAGFPLLTAGDAAPGSLLPVLAVSRAGVTTAFPMRWGLTYPPVPGRDPGRFVIMTSADKAFRRPELHRCAVLVSWYSRPEILRSGDGTEKTSGRSYLFQAAGEETMWLPGFYRMEKGLPVFALASMKPAPGLQRFGAYAPVVLARRDVSAWIDPAARTEALLSLPAVGLVWEAA